MINGNTLTRDDDGWITSSFSNANASCVQVRFAEPGSISVRDSKDRRADSPTISVSPDGWAALLKVLPSA